MKIKNILETISPQPYQHYITDEELTTTIVIISFIIILIIALLIFLNFKKNERIEKLENKIDEIERKLNQ